MPHDGHDHSQMTDIEARVRALESLLHEKGYIDSAAVDEIVQTYETKIGPQNGAHVVAKAWTDPEYAAWLAEDATAAIHALGYISRQGEHMQAFFNKSTEHHLVVCTLCSCYPWSVLGLPPVWYKSPPFRSKAVIDPRGVLRDFGIELGADVAVHIHDSTAEMRYLVIPVRPESTQDWTQDALRSLVTRNAMIGTGFALAPEARA